MGAAFVTRSYNSELTTAQVKLRFADDQDQDRAENGGSYSGGIGMAQGLVFVDKKFASINAAREWLDDNAEKFGPAIAVTAINCEEKTWQGRDNPNYNKKVWLIGALCSE